MTDRDGTKPWIVLVGGFLGAGKTTLILAAARELKRLGQRCAVILNDQGSALVDTQLANRHGMHSEEVTGDASAAGSPTYSKSSRSFAHTHPT